ncbi:MAG: hypothetical protein KDA37_10175 [Planctomycetales bacterium]|nr:hypothetical protein [Planctomycetales bacterium]
MPRYVLLRHECPPNYRSGSHYDLMLECDGVLRTWELMTPPSEWSRALGLRGNQANRVEVAPLTDHRLDYLEYEGAVSEGRGSVQRVAQGTFEWLERSESRCAWVFGPGSFEGKAEIDVKQGLLSVML